ncbi:DsrE family protein [Persephonella sp.]|uniref:DsrE family protein n=1 Tax=Persephonella sp. TaxID=2060922 RepID=UPI0025FED882|nr:DsrE family protein [Persephonella sp.]
MRFLIVLLSFFSITLAQDKGAKLEVSDSTYPSLKVVYDWNLQNPEAVDKALNYIRNHLKAYSEYSPLEDVEIVVVSHGAEVPVFAKQNREIFKKIIERIKNFHESYGVEFYVCYNAAKAFGFDKEDFPDFVILTPAGVAKLAALQEEGYRLVPVVVHDFKPIREKYGKKR